MRSIVLAFALSVAFAPGVCAQTRPTHIDTKQFDTLCGSFRAKLDQSLVNTKIPGATAAVVLPDGRICAAAAGMTRNANGRKLRKDDPILAGSIGKTFFSALALQLVEEGKLDLDKKISDWLGTRPWFARLPNAQDITVRMLMNHTSGLPNHVEEKSFYSASTKNFDKDVPFDYLLTFILNKKPLFAAGKGFVYSDTNYILLAMIEEQITGTAMYDEIATRFLKPLKLDLTSPANKNLDPDVYGYYENKPVVKNGRLMINPQWEWAGGGFWSTPTDLARWARALYSGTVLKKQTFAGLFQTTSMGEGKNYGLGVEIHKTKWGPAYGHDGEWPGYLSVMRYYPKFDVAVAVQYNADGTAEAEAYGDGMIQTLAGIFINEMMPEKMSDADKNAFEALALMWLHLIDAGKFGESWDDISAELKAKYTRAAWPNALKPFLTKTGSFKERRLRSVVRSDQDEIAIDFTSRFSKLPTAIETVFLKRGSDGKWRISSYSIN
jgi:D-alanyl-D-alanine carboxypeptidase